jgi:uncharacterized protein
MRLGILSDTHNRLARTRCAIDLLRAEKVDVLFHCGDLTRAEVVAICAEPKCYFVFGNNDADNSPELKSAMQETGGVCLGWGHEVTLAGKRVAVVHGHMSHDVRRLLAAKPDFLLSGHSHVREDRRQECTRRINPGALHRAAEFTVALLDLESDDLRFLNVPR